METVHTAILSPPLCLRLFRSVALTFSRAYAARPPPAGRRLRCLVDPPAGNSHLPLFTWQHSEAWGWTAEPSHPSHRSGSPAPPRASTAMQWPQAAVEIVTALDSPNSGSSDRKCVALAGPLYGPPAVRSFASDNYTYVLYLEEMCSSVRIHSTEGIIQDVNISVTIQCPGKLNPLLLAST